jgi:DNA-binding beta-propeller fold protein YncE
MVTKIQDDSLHILGNVTIYPSSPQLGIEEPVVLSYFAETGGLLKPHDARFDYIRRKIWIADTGNNQIVKIDMNTYKVDNLLKNKMLYPHAIAVNLNNGGVFVKGYSSYANQMIVSYFNFDATLNASFSFTNDYGESSSSSSLNNEIIGVPPMPYSNTIVYDHVRCRTWWVAFSKVYVFDERNQQVQTYDLSLNGYNDALSIDVELSTGNAIVIAKNDNGYFIIQMNRDNNKFLAFAYIED